MLPREGILISIDALSFVKLAVLEVQIGAWMLVRFEVSLRSIKHALVALGFGTNCVVLAGTDVARVVGRAHADGVLQGRALPVETLVYYKVEDVLDILVSQFERTSIKERDLHPNCGPFLSLSSIGLSV